MLPWFREISTPSLSSCRITLSSKLVSLRRLSLKTPSTWRPGRDGALSRVYPQRSGTDWYLPAKSMTVEPVTVHTVFKAQLKQVRKDRQLHHKRDETHFVFSFRISPLHIYPSLPWQRSMGPQWLTAVATPLALQVTVEQILESYTAMFVW